MGQAMADERPTSTGWLPPVAPGPRAVDPGPAPAPRPTFSRRGGAATPSSAGNAQAVWALVLAITALVLLLISLGTFFVVTVPCSIAALVLAGRARRRVEAGETAQGAGQAVAALWIARIGVIAGVASAIVLIALIASGFDFEQFRDDLERELEQRRQRDG